MGRRSLFLPLRIAAAAARPPAMTSPVTVRPAEAADEAALGRLGALLVAEHHAFDSLRFMRPGAETPAQAYGHFLVSHLGRKRQFCARRRAGRGGDRLCLLPGWREWITWRCAARPGRSTTLWSTRSIAARASAAALMDAALAELAKRGAPRAVLFDGREEPWRAGAVRGRRISPHDDRDDARAASACRAWLGPGCAIGARNVTRSHSAWMLTSSSAISAAATALALQLLPARTTTAAPPNPT